MSITRNTTRSITVDRNLTDLIKFLACLMIALHHYSQDMVVAGTHNPIYQLFSTQGGWLGVAIFFFLSGYGLMKSDMKNHLQLIPFFKRRLLKTYLPAVLVSAIWCGYLVIGGGKMIDVHLLKSVLWYFNDEVLWFVRAIIKLYGAFYVYSWLNARYNNTVFNGYGFKLVLLISLASISLCLTSVGLVHGGSVVLFFIGMNLAEYDECYLKMIRGIYPVIAIIIVIVVLAFIYRYDAAWIHLLINYLLIVLGIVFIASYNITIPVLPKWIGGSSYDIYLVHNKALMLLRPAFAIVPLWSFMSLTTILTIVFYNIRKKIKL